MPLKDTAPVESVPLIPSIRLMTAIGAEAVSIPEPLVTVLPLKQKREYRRTAKPYISEPRALAAPRSSEVVVYMAPGTSTRAVSVVPASPSSSPAELEALIRQKLLCQRVMCAINRAVPGGCCCPRGIVDPRKDSRATIAR